MLDFSIDSSIEATAFDWIIFLFVYVVIYINNKDLLVDGEKVTLAISQRKSLICGLFFFLIYASTRGDFYHYGEMVQNYSVSSTLHMEEIYYQIIEMVGNNYLMWRLVVFGGCYLCLIYTAKRFGVSQFYVMFILSMCYINMYNYARASVAFTIFFFGLSFILSPLKFRTLSYALGALIMYSAHYFHSSAYILLLFVPAIFVPANKSSFVLSLVLFPTVVNIIMYFSQFSGDFALFVEDDKLASKINYYTTDNLEKRDFYGGIGMALFYIFHYGSYFLTTLYIGILVNSKKIDNKVIVNLYKVLFAIMIVSLSMNFSEFGMLFFYRILYMSIVPLLIILAYLISSGFLRDKYCRWCINICMISVVYESLRGLYLTTIK